MLERKDSWSNSCTAFWPLSALYVLFASDLLLFSDLRMTFDLLLAFDLHFFIAPFISAGFEIVLLGLILLHFAFFCPHVDFCTTLIDLTMYQ